MEPEQTHTHTNGQQQLSADDDIALAEELKERYDKVRGELKKLIIGQDDVVELVLLTLLAGGNSLIVGVPGVSENAVDLHHCSST